MSDEDSKKQLNSDFLAKIAKQPSLLKNDSAEQSLKKMLSAVNANSAPYKTLTQKFAESVREAGLADRNSKIFSQAYTAELSEQILSTRRMVEKIKQSQEKRGVLTRALGPTHAALVGSAQIDARKIKAKEVFSLEALGQAVKRVRKSKGYTQQEFADRAGVGRRFISELENAKPSLEISKVLQVAAAAGIDISITVRSEQT